MDCLNAAQMYRRTLEQGFTFDISLSLAPGVVLCAGRRLSPDTKAFIST